MRQLMIGLLGTALAAGMVLPSFAQEQFRPRGGARMGHGGPNVGQGFGGPGRFGGQGGGHRFGGGRRFGGNDGYRRGHRGGYGGYGAAVGAGVAGLAAGALIGGALAGPGYYNGEYGNGPYGAEVVEEPVEGVAPVMADDSVAYCQQRYRSYDVSSGTYLGYDGLRHPCP